MGVSDKSSDGPRQCCLSKGWRSNGEHTFKVYYIVEFDLARAHELSSAPLPAGVTVRLLRGEGEIGPVATLLVEAGLPAATVEQRMRRGDLVAQALTDDGELIAYAWTLYRRVDSGSLC